MSVFCSLCGGRVEPHDGSPIGEAGLRWDAEVRAVRTRAYIHGAYVTGLGFMSPGGELIASVEEGTSYRNAREQLETHQVRPRLGLFWCFPVHGICWDLLRVAIHPARDWPVALVAAHLFDLLYSIPSDEPGHPTPDHAYGGALDFHGVGSWRHVVRNPDLFYLLADPNEAVDPPDPTPLSTSASTVSRLSGAGGETQDVFRKLPSELLVLILENLPSTDCGHLRLASRYTASVSSVSQLPPSFWRTRFDQPHEMAFTFAGREDQRPPEPANWRQMYMTARGRLKNPSTYPGFRHRCHIWQMLQYLAPALSLRLQNSQCLASGPYGGRDPGLPTEASHCCGTASTELVLEHGGASARSGEWAAMSPLYKGCRLYEEQCLRWPCSSAPETICLAVSSVSFNGKVYISGLRYVASHLHVTPREYARAGLVNSSNEQRVVLNKTDILEAMVFNIPTDGMRGLRLDVRGPERLTTHSFGRLALSEAEDGYACISNKGQLQHACFLVGLDACKIVALSWYARKGPE